MNQSQNQNQNQNRADDKEEDEDGSHSSICERNLSLLGRVNKRCHWKGFGIRVGWRRSRSKRVRITPVNILITLFISILISPAFVLANLGIGTDIESCTVENEATALQQIHNHKSQNHHHHSNGQPTNGNPNQNPKNSGSLSSSSSSSSLSSQSSQSSSPSGSANGNLQSQRSSSVSSNSIGMGSSSSGNTNGGSVSAISNDGHGHGHGQGQGQLWGGEAVLCQIRTLHSELDFENLTSSSVSASSSSVPIPIAPSDLGLVTKLRIVCNDILFFESLLEAGQLSLFPSLHELSIEKCKLKYLPSESLSGLRHLRKLTILTGNSDWASRSLELSPNVLLDVPQVRHLNLGFNHMWNLPDQLLCQVGFLQSLNLTHNLLSDIDDLGLPPAPVQQAIQGVQSQIQSQSQSQSQLQQKQQSKFSLTSVSNGGSASIGGSSSSSSSCLAELKSFDLSYNTLRSLGRGRLERMRRLQDLRLDHNWLEELSDEAFSGLVSLKTLNLSSNRLVALPTKLFHPTKLLRELDLRNNSLTTLSGQLLDPLEHLQVLDVSMNSLTLALAMPFSTQSSGAKAGAKAGTKSVNVNGEASKIGGANMEIEAFKGLVRLIILNLSHNEITSLSPATFKDLYTLQVLDLSYNKIASIEPQTFMTLSNLHALNLAKNHLQAINPHTFDGLYVLHKLILDYNEIQRMDSDSLKNCTSLQDLGLVGNQLQSVPSALRSLPLLRSLDLGENRISTLSNQSFIGLGQLYGLRLVDNQLEILPKGLCDPIRNLRVINLAQNRIKTVSSASFTNCPELRALWLDANQLSELPPLAGQLPGLLWLNVSENQLQRIDYSQVPGSLEWLDVSHNQLVSLGGRSTHHSHGKASIRLRVIDASHNLLQSLDHLMVPSTLEVLKLNYNNLVRMAPDTLNRASQLRRVELIGNQLTTIPLTAIQFPTVAQGKPLPEFLVGGNPFLCDCEMEWLMRIQHLATLRSHPIILDLDTVVCRLAYSRSSSHVPLPEMRSQDFLCPYKAHCFALCHCCEFDACDCAMTCPSNCTCYHDATWSANVVDCAGSNQPAIPPRLPMDSTEVYLDGNYIPLLKSHTFIGRKNLRVLYLNASRIETISNKSFNGLQSLQTLHLEENYLTSLKGFEFDHLSRLRELYLHNNKMRSISNNTFLPLKSLEILRLDGNMLVTYAVWQLSLNPYLVDIGLARNKWDCECEYLHQLHSWVRDNKRKIVDLGELRCSWNRSTSNKALGPLVMEYRNNTCGSSSAWASLQDSFGVDFGNLDFISVLLCIVFLLILILTLIVVLIVCRDNIKLWMFTTFGVRVGRGCWDSESDCCLCCGMKGMAGMKRGERDEEKSYDAYLIYSQKDEEFVTEKIADELETNDNYRLCLHHRDLVNETGDLKGMMWGAVDSAKSIIIILSRNFLQGEWSAGESYTAFHSVINRVENTYKNQSHSKKQILYILTETIPVEELMSSEFRTIFSWKKIKKRTLHWPFAQGQSQGQRSHCGGHDEEERDKRFWSMLKFLLPDPSSHYHSNITSNTTTTSASSSGDTPAKYQSPNQNQSQNHGHSQHQNHSYNPNQHLPGHQMSMSMTMTQGQGHGPQPSPMMMMMTNNGQNPSKLWPSPYSPTNFLPPQYQQQQQPQILANPLRSHNQNPIQNQIQTQIQGSLPKCQSPPSNSTDSTTLDHEHIMDDGGSGSGSGSGSSSFYGHSHHGNTNSNHGHGNPHLSHSNLSKSPLPTIKSHGRNHGNGSSSGSSSKYHQYQQQQPGHSHGHGESYLSLEGEHVYSSLDPPSPQQSYPGLQIQLGSNYPSSLTTQRENGTLSLNPNPNSPNGISPQNPNHSQNIHLPNGYTYSPSPRPQPQWHPHPHPSNLPTMTMGVPGGHHAPLPPHSLHGVGIGKGRKTSKNPESVQTYLV